ncbi:MAG: NADH-quinone oxidoreductase subunit NuoH [Chloroflexi bacterium]|nr:NADH-quinone oxidoreductase subunit NuoH [Chloroflexota bacterium]
MPPLPPFDFNSPISWAGQAIVILLTGVGVPRDLAGAIATLLGVIVLASYGLTITLLLIWAERKLVGRLQDRLGPNRVGPYGLLQTIADAFKLFTKEDITPTGADVVVYNLAPLLSVVSVLLIWAVIPFASTVFGTNINVGVIYVVGVGGLGTLAIMMAGWSSNNKYALLGAFRTAAQLISYEVPMILALLVPVLLARSMGMNDIVKGQTVWYIVLAPIAGLIFFITSMAEVGRAPFDLLEAESEIVAGFHIEYTGLKFGMFFVGEFLHAFTISALAATLFFGGWRGPWTDQVPLLGVVYFFVKTAFAFFVVIWVRGSMPRIRIDHMLAFNWKFLTPVSLAAVVVTAVVDKLTPSSEWTRAGALFLANVILGAVVVWILAATARRQRMQEEGSRQEAKHAGPAQGAEAHAGAH